MVCVLIHFSGWSCTKAYSDQILEQKIHCWSCPTHLQRLFWSPHFSAHWQWSLVASQWLEPKKEWVLCQKQYHCQWWDPGWVQLEHCLPSPSIGFGTCLGQFHWLLYSIQDCPRQIGDDQKKWVFLGIGTWARKFQENLFQSPIPRLFCCFHKVSHTGNLKSMWGKRVERREWLKVWKNRIFWNILECFKMLRDVLECLKHFRTAWNVKNIL